METHENDLVIHNHRTVAATCIRDRLNRLRRWKYLLLFENRCYVVIPSPSVVLTGCKVAVDEADRRIIDGQPSDNATLDDANVQ